MLSKESKRRIRAVRERNTMRLEIMSEKNKLIRIKGWPHAFLTFAEFNKLMTIRDKMVADGGWTRVGYKAGGDAYANAQLEMEPEMEMIMGLYYPQSSEFRRGTSYRVDKVTTDGSIYFSDWRLSRPMCRIIQKHIEGVQHVKITNKEASKRLRLRSR